MLAVEAQHAAHRLMIDRSIDIAKSQ
jgi:hypothetical protein